MNFEDITSDFLLLSGQSSNSQRYSVKKVKKLKESVNPHEETLKCFGLINDVFSSHCFFLVMSQLLQKPFLHDKDSFLKGKKILAVLS